ncbi:hypothetical protein BJX99DRAFT_265405 [Aspergillus californicus]
MESVVDSHEKTFGWIFEHDAGDAGDASDAINTSDTGDAGDADDLPGKKFTRWLLSGTGMFHIAGKLGSGKSTLMKFLYLHPRTQAELQKWAGNRRLVTANHFFWKPGSPLQRSLRGLIRSLLYDVLEACPELIPSTFPNQWRLLTQSSRLARVEASLQTREIHLGFSRLMQVGHQNMRHCFCFFIDGLDEYDETIPGSYRDLVKTLCDWVQNPSDSVKICVSSRENNVFAGISREDQHLRLQDLTRRDIKLYVHENFKDICDNDEYRKLRELIIEKADGVFLWVAVVTKSIRDQLEDGFGISTVIQELEALPIQLEALFYHILMSKQSRSIRRMAFHTLAMVMMGTGSLHPVPCTLAMYYFMEDYENDPEFATNPLISKPELIGFTAS